MPSTHEELGTLGRRFYTGHQVFDQIVQINFGSSLLMLDETFTEAQEFLHTLLKGYGKGRVPVPVTTVSRGPRMSNERSIDVRGMSLSDTSIAINELRKRFRGHPFIHSILPDLLIGSGAEDVLRVAEAWQRSVAANETVEFYLLPKGTFEDFEKKILSITDGAIEISLRRNIRGFQSTFTPIRCCRPEYHLRQFPYKLEEGKLLIEWEGEFSDTFVGFTRETILTRASYIRENLSRLRVYPSGKAPLANMSIYDYWLLSQLRDRGLLSLSLIFPEDFNTILERVAKWQLDGVIRLEETAEPQAIEPRLKVGKRRSPTRWTRLGLMMPLGLASAYIGLKTKKIHKVPSDVLTASRKATIALLSMLLEQERLDEKGYMSRLMEMEKRFGEITARLTALKRISDMGEDVTATIDPKHLGKIIGMTFIIGYETTPTVRKKAEDEYEVVIEDCPICRDMVSDRPMCAQFEGTIEGICGVVLKSRWSCDEVSCKAMNDEACVFRVKPRRDYHSFTH